jgi:sugar phosphate isomerase/epimerase
MIGFSCPPYCLRPFREIADLVVGKFELWEIVAEAEHFLPGIEKQIKELKETSKIKLSIHAPFSDINIAAFDEPTRKYSVNVLLETFEIASRLDIGVVTIHPGSICAIQTFDKEKVVTLTRKSLEEISKKAGEYSTTIALENMPEMRFAICKTKDSMEKMLAGLENIKICYDIGHANTTGQLEEMPRLKNRFANVHLHDNVEKRDEHFTLGAGNINFKKALKSLGEYNGNYIIEATSLESGLASKKFLEKLL